MWCLSNNSETQKFYIHKWRTAPLLVMRMEHVEHGATKKHSRTVSVNPLSSMLAQSQVVEFLLTVWCLCLPPAFGSTLPSFLEWKFPTLATLHPKISRAEVFLNFSNCHFIKTNKSAQPVLWHKKQSRDPGTGWTAQEFERKEEEKIVLFQWHHLSGICLWITIETFFPFFLFHSLLTWALPDGTH